MGITLLTKEIKPKNIFYRNEVQKFISDCRYRVIESSSLVPVLFREVLSHPYISFFHLLVNGFSVTCQVGLARAVSPTNTNFRLTFLLTRLQEALYDDLAV